MAVQINWNICDNADVCSIGMPTGALFWDEDMAVLGSIMISALIAVVVSEKMVAHRRHHRD